MPQMVKAYLNKTVKIDEFITHKMDLDKVNDAIELMKYGKWLGHTLVLSLVVGNKGTSPNLLTCLVSAPQHPNRPESFSTMRHRIIS